MMPAGFVFIGKEEGSEVVKTTSDKDGRWRKNEGYRERGLEGARAIGSEDIEGAGV